MPKLPDFHTFYGVDFSGARQAGRNTWVARVEPRGKTHRLALASLDRLESLAGTAERAGCLAHLVELVTGSDAALWGFDFPFGMPVELFPELAPWTDQFTFLGEWGEEAYDCGLECIRRARLAAGRMHIRRTTDDDARAPFDAYHYRMIYQTFYGMRDVMLKGSGLDSGGLLLDLGVGLLFAVAMILLASTTLRRRVA